MLIVQFRGKDLKCLFLLLFFSLFTIVLTACEVIRINQEEIVQIELLKDDPDSLISHLERGCYDIVSNESKELLSCGPAAVVIGREMTVTYLADEESPIETEASSSIFLRASRFSLDNVTGTIQFVEVVRANASLNGQQFDSDIPYEPNLLSIGDSLQLCIYRKGGIQGPYVCCDISIDTFTCSNYRSLTLDGKLMTPSTVISAYKKVSSRDAQSVRLIFTTRIFRDGEYYYGYLGGYGYFGLIIRSRNGVDWESVASPEQVEGLTYIIEGAIGKDPSTGNLILCGRGNDVMICGFDGGFHQIIPSRLLSGTTTSRPTIFTYQGHLYLIVNMKNDTDYSVGRRNTANIYRIDGGSGELTLVKTIKCKDGCAYHSVQVVNDEIWLVFQTDGRHIALENQGRSNLALVRIMINR